MKFEASQRKCGACGETGHNARTCKSKSVPFSTGGFWNEKSFDGLEQLGLPFVDASHVAMISKVIDGEVLKEPNARVRIPNITWKEEPITMTWGELDEKCKKQDLVSIGESTYSGAYLRGALAYLPKNTVLTLYTGYHYPLKATFEYGGEEWILFLAPRVENHYAETITRTSYACSACGREHQQERDADECCFAGCPHTWEMDKTTDWGDGMFTMNVSCRKCGAKSYIEGHADENSDSNPTPKFNAESLDMKNAQGSNMEYECQVCGKPADYNFQDATIRWEIVNDEFSESPKVSEYAGQMQNDFYCQEHADEMETSDFYAESLKNAQGSNMNQNVLTIAIDISGSTSGYYDHPDLNKFYRKMAISAIMSMKPEQVILVPFTHTLETFAFLDWKEAVKWLKNDKNLQPMGGTMSLDYLLQELNQMQELMKKRLERGQYLTFSTMLLTDLQPLTYGFGKMIYGAESLKFKEWADQEMMTHGGRESFQDWLDDEVSSHGNTSLEDWGEHEIASHEARYEAETPLLLPHDEEGDICDGCDKEGEFKTYAYSHGAFCEECVDRIKRENADPTFGLDSENVLSMKNLGAVAVGGALGIALVGLFTGKNLLTDMTSKLSKASEAKKDCHSCNTNGSVRKNHTQVLSSEYSVGQINPVEVEGQQDIHGAEGVNNPRFAPSPSPAPHRAKSSKWL